MSEKWKKFRSRTIEWFKDIAALIKENRRIFIVVIIFIVAIIVAIVVTDALANKTAEAIETEVVTEIEQQSDEYAIPQDELEVDAHPEINDLMKKYYNAAAAGDVNTINTLRTGIDDKETIVIEKKSEYIKSYPTLTCYTKKGPIDDSYLVYVYYEVLIEGYDDPVPGLNVWYVCKDSNGSYYINEEPQDEKIADYCKVLSVQDDVVDLSNTVNVKFNELMASNEELAAYMDELAVTMKVAVGEELAKVEVPIEEVVEEEPVEEENAVETIETVKATTVVNVRSSDSESADKLGKAQEGQEFKLLEEKVNGWSKIEFEGQEAYIKTEFLESVGKITKLTDDSEEATDNNDNKDTAKKDETKDEAAAEASPSSGSATVKETINVRKSATTDSEKLGVLYSGDKIEVVTKQSDGWSKIKYNGKTGYVKSEFLK